MNRDNIEIFSKSINLSRLEVNVANNVGDLEVGLSVETLLVVPCHLIHMVSCGGICRLLLSRVMIWWSMN